MTLRGLRELCTSGFALVVWLGVSSSGCGGDDTRGGDCTTEGAVRCHGTVVERCSFYEGLVGDDGPYWYKRVDCASSGGLCKEKSATSADCVQAPDPNQACSPTNSLWACDGNSAIRCDSSKYVTAQKQCVSCTDDSTGGVAQAQCAGGLNSPCAQPTDCVEGLSCLAPSGASADTFCSLACATIEECRSALFGFAMSSEFKGYPSWLKCTAGYCYLE